MIRRKQIMEIGIVIFLVLLIVVIPAGAWGTSIAVATIDDNPGSTTGTVSQPMGSYVPSEYPYPGRTFTSLDTTGISAATLSGKDTLILWGYDPFLLSASQRTDLIAWIEGGGKLIIWDAEDAFYGASNTFDYSWLPYSFSIVAPGPEGDERQPLFIIEENQLSTYAAGPYQILNYTLGWNTDAVGDAAVFTATNPNQWCVDMVGTNVLNLYGPVHVYSKPIGTGIIIYSGLDWDDRANSGAGLELKKMLRNELNSSYLPCSVVWEGNLVVTKDADKGSYLPGETITFTVNVTNPADNPSSVYNAVLTDSPPAEITLTNPAFPYNLGTIAPGQKITVYITATADSAGVGLKNVATAEGDNQFGQHVYIGIDDTIFDIGTVPVSTPEFPTLAVPAGMLVGMMFIIYSIRKKE